MGNKKGQVGVGLGKANEVPEAIKKAGKDADGNLIVGIKNDAGHKVLKFDSAGKFVAELQVPPHDKGPRGPKKK